jgi:hypothetical protein
MLFILPCDILCWCTLPFCVYTVFFFVTLYCLYCPVLPFCCPLLFCVFFLCPSCLMLSSIIMSFEFTCVVCSSCCSLLSNVILVALCFRALFVLFWLSCIVLYYLMRLFLSYAGLVALCYSEIVSRFFCGGGVTCAVCCRLILCWLILSLWDFKFSRLRVWCSELSSGIYNHFTRQYIPEDNSEHYPIPVSLFCPVLSCVVLHLSCSIFPCQLCVSMRLSDCRSMGPDSWFHMKCAPLRIGQNT